MLDFPDLFDAGDGRGLDKHYFIEHDIAVALASGRPGEAEFKTALNGIQYLETVRWYEEQLVQARLPRDLGVERDREQVALAHGDRVTVDGGEDLDVLAAAPRPTARG